MVGASREETLHIFFWRSQRSKCFDNIVLQYMVARFVTAIATLTKLGTYVAFGDLYSETKSLRHIISGLATRGRYFKKQKQNWLYFLHFIQLSTWSVDHSINAAFDLQSLRWVADLGISILIRRSPTACTFLQAGSEFYSAISGIFE